MNHYKVVIAYDGTDFFGWQWQPEKSTVVGELQKSFAAVFHSNATIIGASRTDTGVHALGQVALVKTELSLDAVTLFRAWNNALPPSIVIRCVQSVDESFHPQRKVQQKTYWYHVFNGIRPLPFVQHYGYYQRYPFEVQKLEQALQVFVGTHDFRSFCSGWDMQGGTIRTIDRIELVYCRRYNVYRIVVKGPGFLRYMIRRIVGACLEVASRSDLSLDVLHKALAECDPEQTLPKAPAKGLLLYKIIYEK